MDNEVFRNYVRNIERDIRVRQYVQKQWREVVEVGKRNGDFPEEVSGLLI